MFLADGLIYLELQKTGGSHINRLLSRYTGGAVSGKHHRLDKPMPDHYIIGSIRNPWDWYVSLWAFGCGGKGALRSRTGKKIDWNLEYYLRLLPESMGRQKLAFYDLLQSVYHDALKPVSRWQQSYRDATSAEGFRNWLKLLLAEERRFDIGEGFGFSPLSRHSGLLCYRYFRLFTLGDSIYDDQRLHTFDGLADYDREMNITQGIICTETLESDFVRVLAEAGVVLSDEEIASICNQEGGITNASTRRSAAYYYDDETISLVAEKEKYLIGKYGFSAPVERS